MSDPLEAASELHEFLTAEGVSYVIIGGLAVQHWGEPRLTVAVDLTVSVRAEQAQSFVQTVISRFSTRVEEAAIFARDTRVIPIRATNGCPVDISLAIPGYEDSVMARAVLYETKPGQQLRFCSAEDLIIHKAVAGRPLDLQDIEGIVFRQRETLDARYIRDRLREFSAALEVPELAECFEGPWRRLHQG